MAVAVTGTPEVLTRTAAASNATMNFTSTSFGAGEIILLIVTCQQNEGDAMPSPQTPTGGSLTWNTAAGLNSQGAGSSTTRTTAYWAHNSGAQTFAPQWVITRASGNISLKMVMYRLTGANTTTPIGASDGHIGTTDPLTTNSNLEIAGTSGSMLFAAGCDWAARTTVTATFDSSIADTEEYNTLESGIAHYVAIHSTSALGGDDASIRCGLDATSNGDWSSIFFEVEQASAAATAFPWQRRSSGLLYR
jgi:hypothetical protein